MEVTTQQILSVQDVRNKIVGLDKNVPIFNAEQNKYINFDNAATTPAFRSVIKKVESFCDWYGSVHRGTGFKSLLSTHVYNQCRRQIMEFVCPDIDNSDRVVIFTSNTTCAINKLCQHIDVNENEVILTTVIEHHSNMLPWRVNCPFEYVDVYDDNSCFRLDILDEKLRKRQKKVRLVAITGASNVTGIMPPIHEIARIVHKYGAELLVDAAQLIAAKPVNMLSLEDDARIDYLVFSAHKMYAPFGIGVLVGPKLAFQKERPSLVGGGTVDLVTLDDIQWTDVPEKEEAGTPNLLGVIALSEAIKVLGDIGWDYIVNHSRNLIKKLLAELEDIPEVVVYGNSDFDDIDNRGSAVAFNVEKIPHALLAAILSYEYGIGVRNGCFCAHPYIIKLLKIKDADVKEYSELIKQGDHSIVPGMVRVSFGIYNTEKEIGYFINALKSIINIGPQASYLINKNTGEYFPEGQFMDFDRYFTV